MAGNDKADVWMPLYIGDYLADTTRLTTEQHGAYLLLIMDYWKSGAPPDNDAVLCQITRMSPDAWSNARAMLKHYFSIAEGCWKHNRIEEELAKARVNRERASDRAAKAAAARWAKTADECSSNARGSASSTPQAMLNECPSPSPSPSPSSLPSESPSPSGVGASGDANSKPASTRGSRLKADLVLPDDWRQWAQNERPDLVPESSFARFQDYWVSQPGQKGVKLDWFATWRNWVRNERADSKPRSFADQREQHWKNVEADFLGISSGSIIDA